MANLPRTSGAPLDEKRVANQWMSSVLIPVDRDEERGEGGRGGRMGEGGRGRGGRMGERRRGGKGMRERREDGRRIVELSERGGGDGRM